MLVVNRFLVAESAEAVDEFTVRAGEALAALAACPGYLGGRLGRALDEPEHWMLVTEWSSVGAYRRALGAFDVKVRATPLLAQSLPEPSAYEILAGTDETGQVVTADSDRADAPNRTLRSPT
ncbi:MAG TPA: antibiotic biosynthesis monooxygenase [Micromonosporaceae bacterium]